MDIVEEAQNTVDKVFGDVSVSEEETKNRLKELIDYISVMIDTLNG